MTNTFIHIGRRVSVSVAGGGASHVCVGCLGGGDQSRSDGATRLAGGQGTSGLNNDGTPSHQDATSCRYLRPCTSALPLVSGEGNERVCPMSPVALCSCVGGHEGRCPEHKRSITARCLSLTQSSPGQQLTGLLPRSCVSIWGPWSCGFPSSPPPTMPRGPE